MSAAMKMVHVEIIADINSGKNVTPAGYSKSVAIPGSIQFVSAGS